MGKEEVFFMKCPTCGNIFSATEKDIKISHGSGKQFIPCPREYSFEQIRANSALKPYCTGYPEYPKCVYKPE